MSAWLRSETFKKGTVHGEGGFCLLRTRDLWVRAILDCDWSPQTARLSLSMTHVSLTVLDLGRARQGEAGQASSVVVVLLYQRLSPEPSAQCPSFPRLQPASVPLRVQHRWEAQGPQALPVPRTPRPSSNLNVCTQATNCASRVESSRPAGVNRLLLLKQPRARRIFLGWENGRCPSLVMSNSSISGDRSPRSVREQHLGAD